MADMDILDEILRLETELNERYGRNITKITMARDVHDWLVDRMKEGVEATRAHDAQINTMLGVPCLVDNEFWAGQVRLHVGESYMDCYVRVPVTLPGHAFFVNAVDEHLREVLGDVSELFPDPSVTTAAAFADRYAAFRSPVRPLSTIRDLTIPPLDA